MINDLLTFETGKTNLSTFGIYSVFILVIFLYTILVLALVLCLLQTIAPSTFRFFFEKFLKLMIFPAFKGFGLAFLSMGPLIMVISLIWRDGGLKFIDNTYDGDTLKAQSLLQNSNSRLGMALLSAGILLTIKNISSTMKFPNESQAKMLLEENWREAGIMKWKSSKKDEKAAQLMRTINAKPYRISLFLLFVIMFNHYTFSIALKVINSRGQIGALMLVIVVYPLIRKVKQTLVSTYCSDDWLYVQPIYMYSDSISSLNFLKCSTLYHMVVLHTLYRISYVISPQLIYRLKRKILLKKHGWWLLSRFFSYDQICKKQIQKNDFENAAESILNLCSCILSELVRVLFLLFLMFVQKESGVNTWDLEKFGVYLIYLAITIPIQLMIIGISTAVMHRTATINIYQLIEIGIDRFKRRGIRWATDSLTSNKFIDEGWRSIYKLGFSSQMYYFLTCITLGMLAISASLLIFDSNKFNVLTDPAWAIIPLFVYIYINLTTYIGSKLAIKFKIYEPVSRLDIPPLNCTAGKFAKPSAKHYLELPSVKHCFMRYNSQWMIDNITRIFTRYDFKQQNSRLLTCYVDHLNKKKKVELMRKRAKLNAKLLEAKEIQKCKVAEVPIEEYSRNVRPFMSDWLNLAKQFVYLKRLIHPVRVAQKEKQCAVCKIDIELQLTQEKPFPELVNMFRVHNIGSLFDPDQWVKFYSSKQVFKTLCLECRLKQRYEMMKNIEIKKDDEKNRLEQVARTKIRKWLYTARSIRLHQGKDSSLILHERPRRSSKKKKSAA